MLGSVREPGSGDDWRLEPGTFGCYVVTDEPDALFARAKAAGATVLRELHETDYGSRDFAIRDPEGNLWWEWCAGRRRFSRCQKAVLRC